MSKSSLTAEQLKQFEETGFLIIPSLYSAQEIREVSDWIDELVARPVETGKQMAYFEDSLKEKGTRVLSRLEKFSDYHDNFRRFINDRRLTHRLLQLLEDDAVLFKEKINFKMPGGAGFEPHQDVQPGWDDYCPYFISVLVTVDKSTVENGCLELSSGHHKRGLLGEKWKPLTGDQLVGVEFVQYPMEPGDVAFFDCFVPHQSKPNLTDKQRRNLYLTYNRAHDGDHRQKYFADKRLSYPPDAEREPGKEYSFKV